MIEQVGQYQVLQLLGQGGMGQVYLGEHLETKERVAIKVMLPDAMQDDPQALERAQLEAEALRRLNHPSIVKVMDVTEAEGLYVIVMEYVGGGNLYDLISQKQPLPLGYVLRVGLELSDALTRAHHLKIIHRDLKPANILLAEDGTSRLTDFGVARMDTEQNITQTGVIVGSPSYLAPEMIMGEAFDHRADIWAFGVVLFELLKGGKLFDGKNPAETMYRVMTEELPKVSDFRDDVPPELQDLIYRMLERDPEKRINSMRKVGAVLEELIQSLGVDAQKELPPLVKKLIDASRERTETRISEMQKTAVFTPRPPTKTNTLVTSQQQAHTNWLLAGILLVMVLGLGAFWFAGRSEESPSFRVVSVEAVSAGKHMILVGQLESLDGSERRISDFIVRDLQNRLEKGAPLAAVEVRAYPHIIHTAEEAQQAAAANNALIVIWGNYRADLAELNLHVGQVPPDSPISREQFESASNVLVQLEDEQRQSVARQVANMLFLYNAMQNHGYEAIAGLAVLQEITANSPEIVGADEGAYVHRAMELLFSEPSKTARMLEEALRIDSRNPLIYDLQAVAFMRAGQIPDARDSSQTALRLGGPKWQLSHIILGNLALMQNNTSLTRREFEAFLSVYPDDWFLQGVLGINYYLAGDYEAARAAFDQAIAAKPPSNLPYIFASLLAIREGRVADAQALLEITLTQFSDPSLGVRVVRASSGGEEGGGAFYAYLLSGFVNLTLGQNRAALADFEAALALQADVPEVYLMQGLAYCLVGEVSAAEAAYTQGLALDDDFTVLYLLRAEVRSLQNKLGDSLLDFGAAQATTYWPNFEPVVNESLASGNALGCQSFFEF